MERQESPSEGITPDKAQRRDALEEQALLFAGGVAAFAAVTGDELLATTVRVTPTSLGALTDGAVERIFTAANDNLAALADYGVTGANLAKLRTRIAATRMPFGRCAGRPIYDIPAEYLAHFEVKGWPGGRLGDLLRIVYHTKVDGADCIFDAFR